MFLTAWVSVPKRKSLLDSAGMCQAESLMLFSTGFGFQGLARTSPWFFSQPQMNTDERRLKLPLPECFQRFKWSYLRLSASICGESQKSLVTMASTRRHNSLP